MICYKGQMSGKIVRFSDLCNVQSKLTLDKLYLIPLRAFGKAEIVQVRRNRLRIQGASLPTKLEQRKKSVFVYALCKSVSCLSALLLFFFLNESVTMIREDECFAKCIF